MGTNKKITATSEVIRYMREHQYITAKIAYDRFGVERLASIIFNLRQRGYQIDSVMILGTNRYDERTAYARYFLRGEPNVKQSDSCN